MNFHERQTTEQRQVVEKFSERFRNKLQKLAPVFLQMRATMGIGKNIGLASLHESHDQDSTFGFITSFDRNDQTGTAIYGKPSELFGLGIPTQEKLSEAEKRQVIVFPEITEGDPGLTFHFHESLKTRGGLVSIFDPLMEEVDGQMVVDDRVIIGVMAHELGEFRLRKLGIPEDAEKVKSYLSSIPWGSPEEKRNTSFEHDKRIEAEYDLLAAHYGYRSELIAALEFFLERNKRLAIKYSDPKVFDPLVAQLPDWIREFTRKSYEEQTNKNLEKMNDEIKYRIEQLLTFG